MKESNVLVKVI